MEDEQASFLIGQEKHIKYLVLTLIVVKIGMI